MIGDPNKLETHAWTRQTFVALEVERIQGSDSLAVLRLKDEASTEAVVCGKCFLDLETGKDMFCPGEDFMALMDRVQETP